MILKLQPNRVWRPFIGGKLLEQWQGEENPSDGNYPERWIASCTLSGDGKGLSRTVEGQTLSDMPIEKPKILVKILDSRTRLMIQSHPNDEQAQRYFKHPYGKTEMWYILDTRRVEGEEPYVLLGFKEGITREKWVELFVRQEISAQLDCLNRVSVKKGDCFFVPANVPHAMGSGVFFAELQQPTDITFRTERITPDGKELEENMLHQGIGFESMFDCFDYRPSEPSEYRVKKQGESVIDNGFFKAWEIDVTGTRKLALPSAVILVILSGGGLVGSRSAGQAEEFYINEENITLSGDMKVLMCEC